MSRPFLGYIGSPDLSTFDSITYQGVATLDDKSTLVKISAPPLPSSLTKPGGYGAFYNTTAVEYTNAELETGILIDGNASSNPDYAGAYKLFVGEGMTLEFHLWGAGGGDGGAGTGHSGYTKYVATFEQGAELGLYLPGWNGVPTTAAAKRTAQWPDAGSGGTGASNHGYSGGGSARLGPLYADLTALNASSATFYAIAGGGGGSHMYSENSGAGGGASGTAAGTGSYGAGPGGGGSQAGGGTGGVASSYGGAGLNGAKYQGGNGVAYSVYGGGGGGGGGYFGGGAGGTVYAAGGGGAGYIDTSFSGYSSGSTTAGSTTASPAGNGYTKPTGAGDGGKRGAIFFKKV